MKRRGGRTRRSLPWLQRQGDRDAGPNRASSSDPEAAGHLGPGLITPTGDGDHVMAELERIRSGHELDPSTEDHVLTGKESTRG